MHRCCIPSAKPVPLLYRCTAAAEQYIQDEVSGISERRRAIAAALITFAVLTLIPMAPEVADVVAVGTPSNFI